MSDDDPGAGGPAEDSGRPVEGPAGPDQGASDGPAGPDQGASDGPAGPDQGASDGPGGPARSAGSDAPVAPGTGGDGGDRSADPDRPAGPDRRQAAADGRGGGPVRRLWNAEEGPLVFVRDLLSSALMVVLVAGLLFGLSGVWPPMVAVKSGSMNPHMFRGDLVFVTEQSRFAGDAAVEDTGVVTHQAGREVGHRKFGMAGDVIVYRPNNDTRRDPIIHRAMFWVEAGENWYDEANGSHVNAESCAGLVNCPAPNDGFITKGDNPRSNQFYDQARGMSRPVKPAWIEAKAMVRVPALGLVRLEWNEWRTGAAPAAGGASAAGLALLGGLAGRRLLGAS